MARAGSPSHHDPGEPAGGQGDTPEVDAGDVLALGGRTVREFRFRRQLGSDAVKFLTARRVDEITCERNALTLPLGHAAPGFEPSTPTLARLRLPLVAPRRANYLASVTTVLKHRSNRGI